MRNNIIPLTFVLAALFPILSSAQESGEAKDRFGGWAFVEVSHQFKKPAFYLTGYIEHDNFNFNSFDCVYGRFSVGYRPLKWLKVGVNYVPLYEQFGWLHYYEADVMGTLKSGDLSVSVRERYRHCLSNGNNELRSRLKVAYSIPDTKFTPYLAAEVFTWGTEWKKTRHYVACAYDITEFVQVEWYYLYYAFKALPPEHVIGLGLNFTI